MAGVRLGGDVVVKGDDRDRAPAAQRRKLAVEPLELSAQVEAPVAGLGIARVEADDRDPADPCDRGERVVADLVRRKRLLAQAIPILATGSLGLVEATVVVPRVISRGSFERRSRPSARSTSSGRQA